MAIQSSGQIEISEIAAEFGGSAPHALSEYYGGGDNVPQGANPGVPTSGEVQMADFYDAVAATVLTIGSNVANVNIKTLTTNAGGDQATPVILTIDSGVTVSSTSTGTPAMITDTGWSNGVTINIINNNCIVNNVNDSLFFLFQNALTIRNRIIFNISLWTTLLRIYPQN